MHDNQGPTTSCLRVARPYTQSPKHPKPHKDPCAWHTRTRSQTGSAHGPFASAPGPLISIQFISPLISALFFSSCLEFLRALLFISDESKPWEDEGVLDWPAAARAAAATGPAGAAPDMLPAMFRADPLKDSHNEPQGRGPVPSIVASRPEGSQMAVAQPPLVGYNTFQ